MRDICRPSPILTHSFQREPTGHSGTPPSNTSISSNAYRFSESAYSSPFTPGPTTAIFYGFPTSPTLGPTASLPLSDQQPLGSHKVTAWHAQFSFFDHVPLEVRENIYEYILGQVIINVDASRSTSIDTHIRKPLDSYHPRLPGWASLYSSVDRPRKNWLCISRQFLFEMRSVLWRTMSVAFERRWDFVQAYIKGTLAADTTLKILSGIEAPTLFPCRSEVFSCIKKLHLNLTRGTDFDDRVTVSEAKRVTKSMLHIIALDMPALKAVFFLVDDRSRLSNSIIAFMPEQWVLEGLLAIKQVRTIRLSPGPGWRGHARNKKNASACLLAMNAVLDVHFSARYPGSRLDHDGITGRELQARLGRRMLRFFSGSRKYKEAQNALAMKVAALETVV